MLLKSPLLYNLKAHGFIFSFAYFQTTHRRISRKGSGKEGTNLRVASFQQHADTQQHDISAPPLSSKPRALNKTGKPAIFMRGLETSGKTVTQSSVSQQTLD